MAKESFSSPMTPDVTGINGGNPRRNSLAGSANGREQSLSLSRRASIGACHDFCKPGKKHESEPKARLPFPTRIMKKPLDQPNLFDSSDSPQRKKISAIRSKSVPNSRTHQVNKVRTSTDSPDGNNSTVRKVLSIKEKASSVVKLGTKYSPNSRSHSYDTSVIINHEVPMNSSDGKPLRKPKSSPRLKSGPSDAGNVMQQDGSSPSGRVHVSSKKVPSNANEKSFSKRPIPLSMKSRTEKLLPDVLSEGLSVQRRSGFSDIKTRNTTATSKVALEEVSAIPRASLSRRASLSGAISLTARKNRNLKVVLPLKNQNEVESAKTEQLLDEHVGSNSDTLEEKTLYVIKLETENVMLESDKNENCAVEVSPPVQDESEYAVTEPNHDSDSAYNEDRTIKMEETDISEGENGGIPRKDGIVFSNANDCRRGKIVGVHSDNNGPWQLTFRQGSVLEENQNNITEGRRTFTRRGVDSDQNDNELGEGKVVLRHQDVLGKQDGQGLFNIIIKETANKLVETRKSKVKALVGAFETVISLQDSKPSSNTVSE
ncbi:hypothetical protein HRI_003595800 [Hibiscus trionum]|uniref:Calmodulin-binding domain-containing protein n=1 Tax=Hibiscus trionum TaxID=183268 RepID=A0A9W7IQ16_HIBTR|nr:hypothetical protein HRI_003595800 [Hibiscus trionum]